MHHDTLGLVIAACRNRTPATGIIADTFRIFDGLAHISTAVEMEPTQSCIVSFTGWVRDGLGPPPPQQQGSLDNNFPIHDEGRIDCYSASAFGGHNYFAVWTHLGTNYFSISGARITQSGQVLDPGGIAICANPGANLAMPEIAYDGQGMYLVVWEDFRDGPNYDVYGARVDTSGQVLDPGGFAICTNTGVYVGSPNTGERPAVAFLGDRFFVRG